MKIPLRISLLLPLLLGLLVGCGKGGDVVSPAASTGTTTADQAEVSAEIARHGELVEDGMSESSDQTALDATPADGSLRAIQPVFFWREIRRVERRFEFAFADTDSTGRPTTAVVTVHKLLHGSFNIVVRDTTPEGVPTEGRLVRKPLDDHWTRRLLLKRVRIDGSLHPMWKIMATSGVRITSKDAVTRLVSLRVQTADLDTTIADPLAFFRLRRILKLDPGAEVTLTATTLAPDDVVLLYARDHRFRFHNNGDHTYTGTWKAPLIAGLHHLGVNALSHGTLFDDVMPYDSQAWILPYLVRPMELADYAP